MDKKLTYSEAKAFINSVETINPGTPHAFPRGVYGPEYCNAAERLSLVWLGKDVRV